MKHGFTIITKSYLYNKSYMIDLPVDDDPSVLLCSAQSSLQRTLNLALSLSSLSLMATIYFRIIHSLRTEAFLYLVKEIYMRCLALTDVRAVSKDSWAGTGCYVQEQSL